MFTLAESLLCIHGIAINTEMAGYGTLPARLDYRAPSDQIRIPMGRDIKADQNFPPEDPELDEQLIKLFEEHCVYCSADWRYRLAVCNRLSLPRRISLNLPNMLRVATARGDFEYKSIAEVSSIQALLILTAPAGSTINPDALVFDPNRHGLPILLESDIDIWPHFAKDPVLGNRRMDSVSQHKAGWWIHTLVNEPRTAWRSNFEVAEFLISEIPTTDSDVMLARLSETETGFLRFWINPQNGIIRWLHEELGGADQLLSGPRRIRLRSELNIFDRSLGAILNSYPIRYKNSRMTIDLSGTLRDILASHHGREIDGIKMSTSWDGVTLRARII